MGGSIIGDFTNLKNRLNIEPSIAILSQDGTVIAGFVDREDFKIYKPTELNELQSLLDDQKLEEIKGDNYKLFIYDVSVIKQLGNIEINNKPVTSDELYNFFTTGKEISQITREDLLLGTGLPSDEDYKGTLFAYLYEKELKPTKSPILFFKNYKDGNIIVYPESMFFKFTKIIPLSWIEGKLNKLKGSLADKTKEAIE